MKVNSENEIAPTKNRYFVVGIAGRIVGKAVRRQELSDRKSKLLQLIDRVFMGVAKTETLNAETSKQVAKAFKATKYWHGTGKYQYRDGKRVDVLDFIIKNKALLPQYDGLDLIGPMNSVSLAKSRMYARAYADMHGKGSKEQNRYGSSTFWVWLFAGDIYVELVKEAKLWRGSNRKLWRKHFREGKAHTWPSKVSTTDMPVPEIFNRGSDIKGNYPILFGVRAKGFESAPTSCAIAIHEVRSQKPLSLAKDVTHIEVPASHVTEVSALLSYHALSVSVLAIEDCESYSSRLLFSKLMSEI